MRTLMRSYINRFFYNIFKALQLSVLFHVLIKIRINH